MKTNNFRKWQARHTFWAPLTEIVLFWFNGVLLMLLYESVSPWWTIYFVIIALTMMPLSRSARNLLTKNAVKMMDDSCDPYPLLQEMDEQLTYEKSQKRKTVLLMNKAVALSNTGDYETDLQILKSINIEEPRFSSIMKIVYYNNLAAAYLSTKDFENAKRNLEINEQAILQYKNEKVRHILMRLHSYNSAIYKIEHGDFDAAVSIMAATDDVNTSKHLIITKSLIWAQIYIGTRRFDEAFKCLNYVIFNGNRLYAVTEARDLIKELRENIMKNTF